MELPLPIPNKEVKHRSAYDTYREEGTIGHCRAFFVEKNMSSAKSNLAVESDSTPTILTARSGQWVRASIFCGNLTWKTFQTKTSAKPLSLHSSRASKAWPYEAKHILGLFSFFATKIY